MKKLMSFCIMGGTLATSSLFSQENPNIIVILADDMGWGDAGCYGGK